jgi:hypothetical protein
MQRQGHAGLCEVRGRLCPGMSLLPPTINREVAAVYRYIVRCTWTRRKAPGWTESVSRPFSSGPGEINRRGFFLGRRAAEREPLANERPAYLKLDVNRTIEIWFQDEARIGQKNKITRRWAKRGTRPSAPRDRSAPPEPQDHTMRCST